MWYVYILLCDSKKYYVGFTQDIDNRVVQHTSRYNKATKRYAEIQLVYQESFDNKSEAKKRESQLKGWTNAKKNALIQGDIEKLKKLSRNPELSRSDRGEI